MIKCTFIDQDDNSKARMEGKSFKEIQNAQENYLKLKYGINIKIKYKS